MSFHIVAIILLNQKALSDITTALLIINTQQVTKGLDLQVVGNL